MTSEHIKRVREEYHIPFASAGSYGAHGGSATRHAPAPELPVGTNEEGLRPDVPLQSPTEAARSPALKRARGESLPDHHSVIIEPPLYERWLPTRCVPVEVIRGDSGRHLPFTLVTDIRWSWHRRDNIYRTTLASSFCSGSDDVGCDLEEVVRAYTCPPDHGSPRWGPSPLNEESPDGGPLSLALAVPPRAPPYYFTKTSTSRVSLPVAPPAADYVGPRTASLLADCLLQCAAEEASVSETTGWAWLYHGKSLRSEAGRALLETQLLAACVNDTRAAWAEASPPSSSLSLSPSPLVIPFQICVFRKC